MAGGARNAELAEVCRRARWSEADALVVLEACKRAHEEHGESFAAFCRRVGIDAMRLHQWRRKLAPAASLVGESPGVDVGSTSFVPLVVRGGDANAAVVLMVDAVRIEVRDAAVIDPAWLGALVREIHEARS